MAEYLTCHNSHNDQHMNCTPVSPHNMHALSPGIAHAVQVSPCLWLIAPLLIFCLFDCRQCRPGTYKQQATAKPPVYAANLRFQSLDQTSKPAAAGSKSQNQQQNGAKSAPQQNKPKSSVDANGIVVQEVDESVINRMAAGAPQQQQQQRPQQQQQARPQQQPQQQSQQQPQLPGFFSLFG